MSTPGTKYIMIIELDLHIKCIRYKCDLTQINFQAICDQRTRADQMTFVFHKHSNYLLVYSGHWCTQSFGRTGKQNVTQIFKVLKWYEPLELHRVDSSRLWDVS